MRYGLLPADYLVDRIRRDTRLPEFNFRPDDLREWLAEAVRDLKASGVYAERTQALHYTNYSCPLPTDWAGYKCGCAGFKRSYDRLLFPDYKGVAKITYYVLPVDQDGVPMLIDESDALHYFFWYVAEKLCYLGDLPSTFTVQDCFMRKLDHKKAAETTLSWPTSRASRRLTRRHL